MADGGINPESRRAVRGAGLCVWLMRGCGLRIEEALAVTKEDFIEDGSVLRVAWQASGDGKRGTSQAPQGGEYRDVPVLPGCGRWFGTCPMGRSSQGTGGSSSGTARSTSGSCTLPRQPVSLTASPHSLRHAFASAMLARGVQITELAHFLGHRDINVTHRYTGICCPPLPNEP